MSAAFKNILKVGPKMQIVLLNFCVSTLSLYYWLIAHNDFDDFNTFFMLRFRYKFAHTYRIIKFLLLISFIISIISLISKISYVQNCFTSCFTKINKKLLRIIVLYNLVSNILFLITIYALWPDSWALFYKSIQFYYLYHHFAICTLLLFVWTIWIDMQKCQTKVFSVAIIIFVILIITSCLLVPPCVMPSATLLAPKPMIVGHRGAQYISPENTMISYQIALNKCHFASLEPNVDSAGRGLALETDVQISYDGVPFLLHDSSLFRTTDIRDREPKQSFEEAYRFNYTSHLAKLDAGSWFLEEDPFFDSHALPDGVRAESFRHQSLPLFSSYLALAAQHGVHVVFDLKFPPECERPHGDDVVSWWRSDWNALRVTCCVGTFDKKLAPFLSLPARSIASHHVIPDKGATIACSSAVKGVICECGHPYGPHLTELILDAISVSGISQTQVWWILDSKLGESQVNPFAKDFPNFTYVFPDPIPIQNLSRLGVTKLNLGNHESTPKDIKMYRANNLTVNVYSVNKRWLFSYYWCLGVDSLTTGKCHEFTDPSFDRPLSLMTSRVYYCCVTLMNLTTFCLMLIVARFRPSQKLLSHQANIALRRID